MLHLKKGDHYTTYNPHPAQMHVFSLKPISQDVFFIQLSLDLSPINGISQLPTINKNSQFSPYLFKSPLEQAQLISNEQNKGQSIETIQTKAFQNKAAKLIEQSQKEQRQFFKPKPSSNYCQICKQNFTDYEQHIKHEVHRKKLLNSPVESHFENLIKNFQIQQKKNLKRVRPFCQKTSKSPETIRGTKRIFIGKQESFQVSITNIECISEKTCDIIQF